MKIFLDTANLDAIKLYNEMGIVDGITTNPTLLSKEKGNPAEIMQEIVRIVNGPVSLEVIATKIVQIFRNYDFRTQVLVASVRHPVHVTEAGKVGADVVTLPPDILGKMLMHPLTDKGLVAFLSDWEKVKKENPKLTI